MPPYKFCHNVTLQTKKRRNVFRLYLFYNQTPKTIDGDIFNFKLIMRASARLGSALPFIISLKRGELIPSIAATFV